MKVLLTEPIHSAGIDILERYFDQLYYAYNLQQPEFLEVCRRENPDAIVIRGIPYQITRELVEAVPNLKAIAANVVGTSNIDLDYTAQKGIPVFNVPGGSSDAVAELAFGMLLCLARRLPDADHAVRRLHQFNKHEFVGSMLKDKVLGIVSLGRIGLRVAGFARAFDMRVLAYDPYQSAGTAREHGVELVELEELLPVADYVSLHTPLTQETRGMFDRDTLARIKPGACLINVGRGGVVDEAALADAVREGRLGGAAIDAYEVEPPAPDHPLFGLRNVICTPHIGGSTQESQYVLSTTCCGKLVEYLQQLVTSAS